MTAPMTLPSGIPNSDLDVMRGLAAQMREFQPFASDPELGTDVRRYMRLLQAKYLEEVARVADVRQRASKTEREEISAGPFGAAFIGATEAGTSLAGAKAGAIGGGALGAPLGPVGAAAGSTIGGLVGGLAGWMAGKPLLKAAQVATQEQLDATLESDVNKWIELGAGIGAPLVGGAGAALHARRATALANRRIASAKATQEEANASVAESIAKSRAEQETAKAATAKLELADMQRRMAHPERAAASTAKYRTIQAEAAEKVAKAKTAEWEAVIAEAKALGQMSPAEKLRLEILGRQLVKTDMSIKLAEQSVQAGLLRPAIAQKMLERITKQINVLENTAQRGGAQAGVAAEEFAERLVMLKNQSRLLQEQMLQNGLMPAVAPSSSLAAKLQRLQAGT